jgi:hypothetical protein
MGSKVIKWTGSSGLLFFGPVYCPSWLFSRDFENFIQEISKKSKYCVWDHLKNFKTHKMLQIEALLHKFWPFLTFFKCFWEFSFKKIPKFPTLLWSHVRKLQCAQNNTDYSSLSFTKPKLWPLHTFFRSFWELLVKQISKFQIFSMRSFRTFEYSQNGTIWSFLACN